MRSLLIAAMLTLLALPAQADYQPRADKVVDNVYAIVGPTTGRSADNDALNANSGFIVTHEGVILIDSGASALGAKKLAAAIRQVTDQPVRWVINTGVQDHRWLGNDYFAGLGAETIALERTAANQEQFAAQHMQMLGVSLGKRLDGTRPLPAVRRLSSDDVTLDIGGETLSLRYTDAHFSGDAWVWLPKHNVLFSGDLVFVDRLLGVLPWSSVRNSQKAFHAMETLNPGRIIPGHGQVCDLAKAKRDTGDYGDFLANVVGKAARDMESLPDTLQKYADLPQFKHLELYEMLHRANMSRAFTEFEAP